MSVSVSPCAVSIKEQTIWIQSANHIATMAGHEYKLTLFGSNFVLWYTLCVRVNVWL